MTAELAVIMLISALWMLYSLMDERDRAVPPSLNLETKPEEKKEAA